MSYKVIDGFLSADETVEKINDLVELGYKEKDITIMTKKENEEQLENITNAKIDTVTKEEDKGMLDKIKETFSDSDEENPLGKYDLDDHSRNQYNQVVKKDGFVILVEENTSFTMGRESETTQPSENTSMTGGETGDFNETPGGINPILPGTGVGADFGSRNSADVRNSDRGTTDIQDNFATDSKERKRNATEETHYVEDHEVTKANQELNNQSLTDDPTDSNISGFGIDPKIPPQSLEPLSTDSSHTQNEDTVEPLHQDDEKRK
ncbi:general stress protein [Desemzia sp. RIT804]|uniref:general stress protein n=1 Tax=Desemzia sp. RIT 804 TaxID=2810209 RepID=UPI0019521284|nr:general stress protein [Desemzia sp. RIT 804]MBM6613959.1 general stress protein [Desemzia sp. RIT 804]